MPAIFDTPLGRHHRIIGAWVAAKGDDQQARTRHETRTLIEGAFHQAVMDILKPVEVADYRAGVLIGDNDLPSALALVCDSIGQPDMGWIEKSNVLANTLNGPVAPLSYQATAYQAIVDTIQCTLPAFSFEDLFEEYATYYWEGETTDDGARAFLVDMHGADPADMGDYTLPSQMYEKRPAWMLRENATAMKRLPKGLRECIKRLRVAHDAVKALDVAGNPWSGRAEYEIINAYFPEMEDRSHLPPMTVVPFDHFGREIDAIAQIGMEYGFMDVVGLCPLTDAATIDAWLASLRTGVEYLLRLQELINLDPKDMYG